MAVQPHSSPLLLLPLELRLKVYRALLAPNADKIQTLYHDRYGRQKRLNIHPTILRVNKQTHTEALPILYGDNTFLIDISTPVVEQCAGGSYPDLLFDPQSLLRDDTPFNENTNEFRDLDRLRASDGLIYPHCFRLLRHIIISTSCRAVWGDSQGGYYYSHIATLILRILERLCGEEDYAGTPSKMVSIWIQREEFDRLILHEASVTEVNEYRRIWVAMKELYEKVQKSRRVSVFEVVNYPDIPSKSNCPREVNIETFSKMFGGPLE